MIDQPRARALASDYLARLSAELRVELSLNEAATQETSEGWVFFWNSTSYLRSGAISDALAGNGPLRVARKSGSVERLPVDYDSTES